MHNQSINQTIRVTDGF